MTPTRNDTHIVLKTEDLVWALSEEQRQQMTAIRIAYRRYRASIGKTPDPEYYVINTDESYAEEVLAVILRGEEETE